MKKAKKLSAVSVVRGWCFSCGVSQGDPVSSGHGFCLGRDLGRGGRCRFPIMLGSSCCRAQSIVVVHGRLLLFIVNTLLLSN